MVSSSAPAATGRADHHHHPHHSIQRPDLIVKKLRFYARFIVVCLLLKKMKLVRELVRELARQIEDYGNGAAASAGATGAAFDPASAVAAMDDQTEWSLVLSEVKSFIEADCVVNVIDSDSNSIVLSHR